MSTPDNRLDAVPSNNYLFLGEWCRVVVRGTCLRWSDEDSITRMGHVQEVLADRRIRGFEYFHSDTFNLSQNEVVQSNLAFEISADDIEGFVTIAHKDEFNKGLDDYFFQYHYDPEKGLSPVTKMSAELRLELIRKTHRPEKNPELPRVLQWAKKDIKAYLVARAHNRKKANSIKVTKFSMAFFSLLPKLANDPQISRNKNVYKILVNKNDEIFGEKCWETIVGSGKIEVVGWIELCFSVIKPDHLTIRIAGAKFSSADGATVWNSLEPVNVARTANNVIPSRQIFELNIFE